MSDLLWAQALDPAFSGFGGAGDSTSEHFWYRVVACIVAVAVWFLISFYYVFPRWLQRSDADWPWTAFGKAAALAWLLVCLSVLVCLWPEITLPSEGETDQVMSKVYEFGPRIALAGLALLGAMFLSYYFRSEHEKATA